MVVTTSRNPRPELVARALGLSRRLGLPFVPREGQSLEAVARGAPALVVTRERLELVSPAGRLFYHPGMALRRIRTLAGGGSDPMVEAMALRPGDRVLDCTLGLAQDALVASWVVGEGGRVVGLESVGPIAALVREGLRTWRVDDASIQAAMRRIRVVWADHRRVLPRLPDRSFDVVYFDAMFREPVAASSWLVPLRPLADPRPVSPEAVEHAARVARRRVVVKERRHSPELVRLGLPALVAGAASPVAFGYLDVAGRAGDAG